MLGDGTYIGGTGIDTILMEEMQALKAAIISNIRSTGQWASGATAESMQVTVEGNTAVLYGRKAFGTLETGRKGTKDDPSVKVPYNFIDIIYRWMQAKGIHADPMPYKRAGHHKYPSAQMRGDMYMAGDISHTIATQGTQLYRNGGRADVYSQEIPAAVRRINERLGRIFQASIEESIKLNIKE